MTKRHPCEDETYLTPEEEEELAKFTQEYLDALDKDDKERADELRTAIRDLTTFKFDEKGFWT